MKKCTGNGLHPGEVIKYNSSWCPLCRLVLASQRLEQKIFILERCLRHHEAIKPSRRLNESTTQGDLK